jgi:hypothetical protein
VPHQQVGLANSVRLVVDRESTARNDERPGGNGLHGLPLPGIEVLGVNDDCALYTLEEGGERVVLVRVSGSEEHLQEGRVGQWLTGLQDIELDALRTGLGEAGVPGSDFDGYHKGIVPGRGDRRRDSIMTWSNRAAVSLI